MNRKDYVTNTGATIDPATRIDRDYVTKKLIDEFNFEVALRCYKLIFAGVAADMTIEILKAGALKTIRDAMDDPEEELDKLNGCFRVTKTCRIREGFEETGKVYRFELAFQPVWSYSSESSQVALLEDLESKSFKNSVMLAS